MKNIVSIIMAATLSMLFIWLLNVLIGNGYPEGPSGAFVLPVMVLFFFVLLFLVHPIIIFTSKYIGYIKSTFLIAILLSLSCAALIYAPDVDSSFINVTIIFLVFLGAPLVIGEIIGSKLVNYIWQAMPNKAINSDRKKRVALS